MKWYFYVLGVLVLFIIIKVATREKGGGLYSQLSGITSSFASACRKIINYGC